MMNDFINYKIKYLQEARQDIKEAKRWYRQQLDGLQKRFSSDVKHAIIQLQLNPEAHAVRYKNVRIAHTRTFPFGIHYYIDKGKIK